jgi:hypothetical protein
MDVRCEFQFGGFAFHGNEIRPVEKLNGFRQFCVAPVTFAGGYDERGGGLKATPVNEFCQRRNHILISGHLVIFPSHPVNVHLVH